MNKVIMCGNITKDLEIKSSNSGMSILKFPIALQRIKRDDGADFVNCIAFGKTAETINKYLGKGKKILFEGHVQTGSYDDREGRKVYTTDFVIDRFEFVGGNSENNNKDGFNKGFNDDITPVDDGYIPF